MTLSWIIQLVMLLEMHLDHKHRVEELWFWWLLQHVAKESYRLTWAQLPLWLFYACPTQTHSFLGNKNRLANSMVRKKHCKHYPEKDVVFSPPSGWGWLTPMLLFIPVAGEGALLSFSCSTQQCTICKKLFLYKTAPIKDIFKLI